MSVGSSLGKRKPFTYSFILPLIFVQVISAFLGAFRREQACCLMLQFTLLSPVPLGPRGSLASLKTHSDLNMWNKPDSSAEGIQRQPSVFTPPASSVDMGVLPPTLPTPVRALLSSRGFWLCSSPKATNQRALPESTWPNAKVNFNANGQRNALDLQCVV